MRKEILKKLLLILYLYPGIFDDSGKMYGNEFLCNITANHQMDSLFMQTDTIGHFLLVVNKVHLNNSEIPKYPGFQTGSNPLIFKNYKNYRRKQLTIINWYENNGHPFAKIEYTNINSSNDTISGYWLVSPGPKVRIDSIRIRGDAQMSKSFINRYLDVLPNSVYAKKELDQIDKKLQKLSFISSFKPSVFAYSSDSLMTIYTYLNKKKANVFDGVIGFSTDENSGKLKLTGEANLLLMNSLKAGESFALKWKSSPENSQNLSMKFNLPYLLGSPFGTDIRFNMYKKDTLYLNIKFRPSIIYRWNGINEFSLFYELFTTNVFSDSISQNISDLHSDRFGAAVNINTFDRLINPRRGIYLQASALYGSKKGSGSDPIEEYIIENEIELAVPLPLNFVFFIKNATGYIKSAVLYENELFRIGGLNSLRGIAEESILATWFNFSNFELRYVLNEQSNVHMFYDHGYYKNTLWETNNSDFPLGFGLGINLGVGNGVIKIDYGISQQFDNPVDISTGKVHVGFITTF